MKTTPKDFFLNIGAIVALYWVMISALVVLFDIIAILVPDVQDYSYYGMPRISTFAISSLIIVFPILAVVTKLINSSIKADPTKAGLGIRKWLVYLTMFVAGIVIAGSLIATLNTFLSGALTTRFFLDVIAIVLVAGGTFGYLWHQLKRDYALPGRDKELLFGSSAAVLALIIIAIALAGTPAKHRSVVFDLERINNLITVQEQIASYYKDKGALPESLSDVGNVYGQYVLPVDPETQEAYGYTKSNALSYQICAEFDLDYDEVPEAYTKSDVYGIVSDAWDHPAGPHCFERTINPAAAL